MLNKVLKYDLKYIFKVLVIFYFILLVFSIFTRIFWSIPNSTIANIIGYISSGCTISFIFNILINNLMRLWVRFINNVYKDESYLTHTLPITKKTIYLSKFLSSIITIFTSVLVIFIAMIIAYYSKENLDLLKNSLKIISTTYNSSMFRVIITIFLVFFLEIESFLLSGYTGIIIGHKSNNGKILKSIIYGFISYIVLQIILLIILFIFGLFNKEIMSLFNSNTYTFNTIKYMINLSVIIYTLFIFVYYYIDIKLFKNVNVD